MDPSAISLIFYRCWKSKTRLVSGVFSKRLHHGSHGAYGYSNQSWYSNHETHYQWTVTRLHLVGHLSLSEFQIDNDIPKYFLEYDGHFCLPTFTTQLLTYANGYAIFDCNILYF